MDHRNMKLTYEQLDSLLGFPISEDSFFSEGGVIAYDGQAWELTEVVGDQLFFEASDAFETARKNMDFFSGRSESRRSLYKKVE